MRYREALAEGTAALEKAGIETARLDAWYLLEHVCHITRQYFYLNDTDELKEEEQQEYELAIGKRAERVPLQYIIGEQEFMGLTFKVNPSVLIPRQDTEILVEEILKICKPDARVLDLCTGSGCIIISMVRNLPNIEAYGGDISRQAINAAKENAKLNGITNAEFFVGKAEEVLPEFYERMRRGDSGISSGTSSGLSDAETPDRDVANTVVSGMDMQGVQKAVFADAATDVQMLTPDVIVVDPPRKGCDTKCLETIVQMSPKCVVYVSCDSATLARDLKFLCENGYEVKRVRGCDMFGQTVSVETVVLLSQQKPDDTIEIDLDLDELDATSAELKATYQEIKDYVLKEFGLKVSSLYISQVKRKCGIEVGENYNLPKSENARVPQCPKEKEEAIKAALKYFAMI